MFRLARDVLIFAGSVGRHVSALITGGIVAAGVFVYEHYTQQSISMSAVYCGLASFVLIGCFLTWRKERDGRARLEDKAAAANGAEITPDLPIRDLFFHVRPGILDDQRQALWDEVAGEIQDKLSTGQLRIWGKEINKHRRRLALAPIPSEHWRQARFTYWFVDKNDNQTTQVECVDPTLGKREYTDLQVSRTQVLTIWPGPAPDEAMQIIVGHGKNYESKVSHNLYNVTKTMSVGLRNIGPTHLSNCKLHYEITEPKNADSKTWLREDTFSLNPGEERLVGIASYNEPVEPHPRGGERIQLHAPAAGGYYSVSAPTLPLDGGILTLTATSKESRSRQSKCRFWVKDGKLSWHEV